MGRRIGALNDRLWEAMTGQNVKPGEWRETSPVGMSPNMVGLHRATRYLMGLEDGTRLLRWLEAPWMHNETCTSTYFHHHALAAAAALHSTGQVETAGLHWLNTAVTLGRLLWVPGRGVRSPGARCKRPFSRSWTSLTALALGLPDPHRGEAWQHDGDSEWRPISRLKETGAIFSFVPLSQIRLHSPLRYRRVIEDRDIGAWYAWFPTLRDCWDTWTSAVVWTGTQLRYLRPDGHGAYHAPPGPECTIGVWTIRSSWTYGPRPNNRDEWTRPNGINLPTGAIVEDLTIGNSADPDPPSHPPEPPTPGIDWPKVRAHAGRLKAFANEKNEAETRRHHEAIGRLLR